MDGRRKDGEGASRAAAVVLPVFEESNDAGFTERVAAVDEAADRTGVIRIRGSVGRRRERHDAQPWHVADVGADVTLGVFLEPIEAAEMLGQRTS